MNGWLSKIRMLYPGLFILIESAACKERMYLSSVNFQNFRYQRASQGGARCSGGCQKLEKVLSTIVSRNVTSRP